MSMMSHGVDAGQFIEDRVSAIRTAIADLRAGGRVDYVVSDGESECPGDDHAAIAAIIDACNSLGCLASDLSGLRIER